MGGMKMVAWQKALKQCPDPQTAGERLNKLAAVAGEILEAYNSEQQRLLLALLSGSSFLSDWLTASPDLLKSHAFEPDYLVYPRQKQGLQREVQERCAEALQARSYEVALGHVRSFKKQEMLRIALRDLAHIGGLEQIVLELSNVADVCLDAVYQVCRQRLIDRLGQPYHRDASSTWQPTEFSVLGLGKLGGQELNYSSDVDVIFIYSDEGWVFKQPPRRANETGTGMSNHQFFSRLAETFIEAVSQTAPQGRLYRIDLRLRPEGQAGPLVRSLQSYENYYAQWGQIWERMMLIKGRGVAGNPSLAEEFLELIQPFRYARSLGERVLREVAAMKQRIEQEVVKQDEIDRNVKLGRGGIREVEFTVQVLQVLHGGKIPFLQERQTLAVLEKLVAYNLMSAGESLALASAYRFLRDVEHRLQMESDLQTHTIPREPHTRQRLAALMGFKKVSEFSKTLQGHMDGVRQVFDQVIQVEPDSPSGLPRQLQGAEPEWKKILADHAFRDADKAYRILVALVYGPGYVHVSQHTIDLALQLIPRFLGLCPLAQPSSPAAPGRLEITSSEEPVPRSPVFRKVLSDPDRVMARLDSYVSAYGTRAAMFETWASNPSLFELMLLLFDRSEFLAEAAIRTPDLVDELELSGRLRRPKTTEETLRDLRYGIEDADQHVWIRRYHQTEQMRIGLRDILGLSPFEHNLTELTSLAEACLQYALEVIMRRHRLKKPGFAIIGLGKLGGAELTYGSDLDVVFVAQPGAKDLAKLQNQAVDLMELLSRQTELGTVYAVDARLRPDGAKGLLVNTLSAFEEYYRQRAMLWEIQALSRARFVAGDTTTGANFEKLAARLCNFASPSESLAAYKPDWKSEIARMRLRIEKERTPPGQDALAFKTGAGGLIDAEFIAQTVCLANGWREPNTLRALQRAQAEAALPPDDAQPLIDNYRNLQCLEGILRRWSFAGESVLPVDSAPQYRVAVRCGYPDAESFFRALAGWRAAIRKVYLKFLDSKPASNQVSVGS
jgi:[glutamine synthetase] adenylyltransferase / [glutamine synthetase]-adenylyl-L-tyrosine phosphorylase